MSSAFSVPPPQAHAANPVRSIGLAQVSSDASRTNWGMVGSSVGIAALNEGRRPWNFTITVVGPASASVSEPDCIIFIVFTPNIGHDDRPGPAVRGNGQLSPRPKALASPCSEHQPQPGKDSDLAAGAATFQWVPDPSAEIDLV